MKKANPRNSKTANVTSMVVIQDTSVSISNQPWLVINSHQQLRFPIRRTGSISPAHASDNPCHTWYQGKLKFSPKGCKTDIIEAERVNCYLVLWPWDDEISSDKTLTCRIWYEILHHMNRRENRGPFTQRVQQWCCPWDAVPCESFAVQCMRCHVMAW